jgi:hypothetical protein
VGAEPADRPGDVPWYVSDCSRLFAHTEWRPRRDARAILGDVLAWAEANETAVAGALGFGSAG